MWGPSLVGVQKLCPLSLEREFLQLWLLVEALSP